MHKKILIVLAFFALNQLKAQTFNEFFIQGGINMPYYISFGESFSSIKYNVSPRLSSNLQVGSIINTSKKLKLKIGIQYNGVLSKQEFSNIIFPTDFVNKTMTTVKQNENIKQIGLNLAILATRKKDKGYFIGMQFYRILAHSLKKEITGAGANDPAVNNSEINQYAKYDFSVEIGMIKHFFLGKNWGISISPIMRVSPKPQTFFSGHKMILLSPQISFGLHKYSNHDEK